MTDEQQSPFEIARELAPEIENVLGVTGLGGAIDDFNNDPANIESTHSRDITLGDIVGISGLIVGIVAFIQQIIAGHTLQGASRDQIVERLILRISEVQGLTPDAKERLIRKLINHMMPK